MIVDEDDDESAMQAAMLLSMSGSSVSVPAVAAAPAAPVPSPAPAAEVFMDNDFVNQLLGSVEVDPNDPFIVAAREQLDAATSEKKMKATKRRKNSNSLCTRFVPLTYLVLYVLHPRLYSNVYHFKNSCLFSVAL